jgi:hypothetical protein
LPGISTISLILSEDQRCVLDPIIFFQSKRLTHRRRPAGTAVICS